ncbi:hypothetical protein [Hominenteromicrobium sp.]|uniref:hypothetical protein n=1 Tax=Hominenteromicrobium sp. TaxID=3073581 RepID=UPI003AF0BD3E
MKSVDTPFVLQLNNVSVTKDDEITVSVNDYLNPFSPQDGVAYTRKTSDDLWGDEHAVTVPAWVVIPAGLVIALIVVFVRKKRAA